ncbi:serine/threonine protein kinase [Streptomyces sp. 1114.5]|uniref:serine/threonine-protein kinase n=1 Tax=Streptomyces sp. 1114.5 TaxID=1938830 RepID=UPI000F2A14FA|nr:serine/threonine-protein kinase [Streptomyces sp. 1114.5]RKT19549.1 serine/threonine protein kinase [Streptomyces sp. 1114.5]
MDELQPTDPRQVGRYRITGLLGAGGMGRVYLGQSPSGRAVAVKVVRPELAQDPEFRRRFAREVASARRVNGFFTAAVVDADPEGATPWLATAYVPGMPLDQAIATHGPWPVDSVRALGAGLAEALEAVHAADLVHRDLKPSNVLLAPDGPRVVDFGISVAAEATALTRTGMIVGTPGFMAPEQLTGAPVTPATDVFALGAVLAYAATGTGPFGTGSAQALNFRIAYEEPDLSQLPQGLEIIARCLAKDPAQRPTVTALIQELALVTVENRTPTEVDAPQPTAWLPTPVARALPGTAIAPPSAAAPTPALPPARRPSVLPFWLAIAALALAMFLPPTVGSSVAITSMARGSWPYVAAAAFGSATCATALYFARRGRTRPVPRWPRYLHGVAAVVNTAIIVLFFSMLASRHGIGTISSGVYTYLFGAACLVYGLVRFPSSKRTTPTV